jgi:hypothetical protein
LDPGEGVGVNIYRLGSDLLWELKAGNPVDNGELISYVEGSLAAAGQPIGSHDTETQRLWLLSTWARVMYRANPAIIVSAKAGEWSRTPGYMLTAAIPSNALIDHRPALLAEMPKLLAEQCTAEDRFAPSLRTVDQLFFDNDRRALSAASGLCRARATSLLDGAYEDAIRHIVKVWDDRVMFGNE